MPEYSTALLLLIALAALATGVLHGATGMAGGVVMAAILANLIGIKVAVPVMTCALIISHASRVVLYWQHTDRPITGRVLLFGIPAVVLGALVFTLLAPRAIALLFAAFLMASFPIKRWASRREVRTSPRLLASASIVWGMLAGNVIGPGFFLAPFLLGTGMNRLAFAGTLATVTLVMNVVKLGVFGATDLLNPELLALGAGIGLMTIPGNWLGRAALRRMNDGDHRLVIDVLTVLMIGNFLWLALRPTG